MRGLVGLTHSRTGFEFRGSISMTQLKLPEAPLKSVAELIDLREQLEQREAREPPSERWAYRGQPRDYGSLTPSFQRQFSQRSSGTAQIIEANLIAAFRKHYSKLDDRSADMPLPDQIDTGHDLRCLSVMQHYEIPTRLLDWTGNFWIALYFACSNDPGTDAELWFYERELFAQQRASNPSLDAFMDTSPSPHEEPAFLSPARNVMVGSDNNIVELDPRISPRMRHQYAHHTVSTDVFSDHAALLRKLDTESSSDAANPRVHRILVDGSCKGKTLQFLADTMNTNAGTIFPDVVGLGRFLRWQFDSLRTMML
jgi:FRG domain-containing protein